MAGTVGLSPQRLHITVGALSGLIDALADGVALAAMFGYEPASTASPPTAIFSRRQPGPSLARPQIS